MTKKTVTIGVTAPARAIGREIADRVSRLARDRFPDGNLRLVFHEQCFLEEGHFAGSDDIRAQAFVEMANDPKIDALWFARGGYGSGRILDSVSQLTDAAYRKSYLGYSDVGFLLGRLYADGIGAQAHGPMVQDISREGGENAVTRALQWFCALKHGDRPRIESIPKRSPVVAFNITVLAHMAASPWMPALQGHILYLEDVAEYLYRIDRACAAIFSSEKMRGLEGVRLGRVSEVPENDVDFIHNAEEIVTHWAKMIDVPFLGECDIGHDSENKIVPFGSPDEPSA